MANDDRRPQDTGLLTSDPVLIEARRRWDRCAEWEAQARQNFLEDLKFRHGDSDNMYQWPSGVANERAGANQPCLTMNIIRQHNLQISNQAKKNKQAMKIIAQGNGSTAESAGVVRDLIRHIEYQSSAQTAYSIARDFQIDGGIGWWRIVCDYPHNDTMDQEIFIRPVNDPLSIYMDPDCQQRDCSDANFAFVFDAIGKDELFEAYPRLKDNDKLGEMPLGMGSTSSDWVDKDKVMVCEYFHKTTKPDVLMSIVHRGERKTVRKSLLHKDVHSKLLDDPQTKIRTIYDDVVEWKLIVGEKIIDKTTWPGKYIPLIRVLGEQVIIGGILDRKGHTRAMKDAQRMYNYNASAQVEFAALQGKTPWIVPAKGIEEHETMWSTANTQNHSVLVYNHVDTEGGSEVPIPPPQRTAPPNIAPAYQAGMETAFNQMMMTSGQFQNQMGMMGNERTGEAISQRQEQSDTAVFHFEDSYEEALVASGKQIIDLIPKIYDTKQVKRIVAEDGVDYDLEIDPTAKQAYFQRVGHNNEVIARVFNPNLGKYDVAASVGPAQGSKREEAVKAFTLILTQNPSLTGTIGDLLLKNLDFDDAMEASQRLKRLVPPQALGQGPTQAEQLLTFQLQNTQAALAKALETSGLQRLKIAGKEEMRDIDVYDAETKRMAALAKAPPDMEQLVRQLVSDALGIHLGGVVAKNEASIPDTQGPIGGKDGEYQDESGGDEVPPVPGAAKAPDGHWYMHHPDEPGKFLKVTPKAKKGPAAPPALANAKLAPDGHHYLPDPGRPGKFIIAIPREGN